MAIIGAQASAGKAGINVLNPKDAQKKIAAKLPPQLQEAYQRVVLAGMKMMFSPQTHQQMMQHLEQGQGTPAQNLGQGMAGLIMIMYQKSNGTMPPQVMIPAATYLLSEAVDFLDKTKAMNLSAADVSNAMEIMIRTILQHCGIDADKLQSNIQAKGLKGNSPVANMPTAQGTPVTKAPVVNPGAPVPTQPPTPNGMPPPPPGSAPTQPQPQGA
jgi:hypothetical protein